MLIQLSRKMDKLSENFNKEIKIIKRDLSELKNVTIEMKKKIHWRESTSDQMT